MAPGIMESHWKCHVSVPTLPLGLLWLLILSPQPAHAARDQATEASQEIQAEDLSGSTSHEAPAPSSGTVVRVYDGDTFTLAQGDNVRFRWINTPELRPLQAFAEDARDATERFVIGRKVDLAYSPAVRDRYGRLVADVTVNGESLAVYLLERGLAHVMLIPPVDEDLDYLFEAQRLARARGLGIWTDEHYRGRLHITSFHANAAGNDRRNVNGEYLRVCNITDVDLDLAGYEITNARGKEFVLPSVVVPPGYTVELHSGTGEHQVHRELQLKVFLGSAYPIWSNSGDRATIYDTQGNVMDFRIHRVGG